MRILSLFFRTFPLKISNFFHLFLLYSTFFFACQVPNSKDGKISTPTSANEVLGHLSQEAQEFKELAKPSKVKCWVDGLIVKSQPGKDMPQLATMREGQEAEYMYQRTVRQSEFTLRGQQFEDAWYLIKLNDGTMGWVHGGGIRFVEPQSLLNPENKERDLNARKSSEGNQKVENDWIFVPGKRVGPIKLKSTEEDLVTFFGSDAVSRGEISIPSGKKEACTFVYKGTENELAIVFKDATRTKIKAIYFTKAEGKWQSPEGLSVGMSVDELIKLNEAPIAFYGFDWEYSGVINSWKKGNIDKYTKYFYTALSYDKSSSSSEFLEKMKGNQLIVSNSASLHRVKLYVERIVVYLD